MNFLYVLKYKNLKLYVMLNEKFLYSHSTNCSCKFKLQREIKMKNVPKGSVVKGSKKALR